MKRQHYKGTKEMSKKLWDEYQIGYKVVQDFLSEICSKYKADAIYKNSRSMFGYVLFGTRHETPRGFSSKIKRELSDDTYKKFTVFYPDGRFKEGKEFKKYCYEYEKLTSKYPSFSEFVKKKVSINIQIGHGGYLHTTVAGYLKNTCVISVPINKENVAPDIEGFEKIKKSEYIMITEE